MIEVYELEAYADIAVRCYLEKGGFFLAVARTEDLTTRECVIASAKSRNRTKAVQYALAELAEALK